MVSLVGCQRARAMVRNDDLCFASRIIYLHAMGGEACCKRFQSFSDFRKALVGGIRKDGNCEVIEESKGR